MLHVRTIVDTSYNFIFSTHTKIRAQSAERSRLGPCTMETEHREHGRTRGAAAASSEPGARGISAVDHAWYVTRVFRLLEYDGRASRPGGVPRGGGRAAVLSSLRAPFCFFGFGGGALVFPGLSGKTLVALTCESGGDR